jgi:hypothetical protein
VSLRVLILFFAALVALNYYPVFLGKVPLPTDQIIQFPPYETYQSESALNFRHAEMSDTVTQFYPWRKQAAEAIRQGTFPLWNPRLLSGTPFQADPMTAIFHPLNWLFLVLPAPAAWSLSLMLKVFLAGVFTVLFLREIGASPSGSITGGLAFAFGGFMTTWIGWTHSDVSLWLPLICCFAHRLSRKPSARAAVFLAIPLAMTLLAGHPGVAAFVMVTSACYGMWIILWKHAPQYKQQVSWLLVAGVMSLGLAAIQVLPSVEWLGEIDRTLEAIWPPLPMSSALAFFSRDLSSNPNSAGIPIPLGAMYAGAFCLLGAAIAPFHANKRDVMFFGGVLIISFCSVYGIQPIEALYDRTPVFKGLKKEEALLLIDFSLAVLAGLGVSVLEGFRWSEWTVRRRVCLPAGVILAAAAFHAGAAALSKMTSSGVDWWRSPRSFRVLLVVSAAIILLRVFQVLPRRQWVVLVSIVVAVDVLSFSHAYIPFNPTLMIFPKAPAFDFLSGQPQPFRVAAVNDTIPDNMEPIYGLSSATGYDFMHRRLVSLTEGLRKDRRDLVMFTAEGILATENRVLDLLNVKYILATPFNESLAQMRTQPHRFRETWSDGAVTIFENQRVLPRTFLVPQTNIEIIPDEAGQLARVQETSFDPTRSVILPAGFKSLVAAAASNRNSEAASGVTKYEEGTNWVRIDVNAPAPSVLVLAQIYYPGWAAFIDGQRAPVLRTNYAFTGTVVEAGIHTIEFRFLPASFVLGTILSSVSILLMALVCVRHRRKE